VREVFSFPRTVNEYAARTVAAGVVVICATTLLTGWYWLTIPLAYGFLARVLTGPTLSPLGQLATRVIAPALPLAPRPTAGVPKRFAQGIGATLSTAALISWLAGSTLASGVFVAMILAAATLESVFGFCLGCAIFARLMRAGVIPEAVCEECADISRRIGAAA
jgi:hypothetical protein